MSDKYEKLNSNLIQLIKFMFRPNGYFPTPVHETVRSLTEALVELMPDYADTIPDMSDKLAEWCKQAM